MVLWESYLETKMIVINTQVLIKLCDRRPSLVEIVKIRSNIKIFINYKEIIKKINHFQIFTLKSWI